MANLKEFETYDLVSQNKGQRIINVEHVIEITGLTSYDGNPLTRIKLVNGDLLEVKKRVDEIREELNKE